MTVAELEQKLSHNPGSPLFARLAKEYLTAGRVEEARELCLRGLQAHPSYATARLVLAQCYRAEQNSTKALEYIQEARTLLPDSIYLRTLYDEWSAQPAEQTTERPPSEPAAEVASQQEIQSPPAEILEEEHTVASEEGPVEVTEALPSVTDAQLVEDMAILERMEAATLPGIEEEVTGTGSEDHGEAPLASPDEAAGDIVIPPIAIEELAPSPPAEEAQAEGPSAEVHPAIAGSPSTEEPQLQEPAAEERAEAPVEPPVETRSVPPAAETAFEVAPPPSVDDEGRIVSKTLAEIYASQGAYAEAILTYQLLKNLRPAQSAEYDRRIKELEPKLHEKSPQ